MKIRVPYIDLVGQHKSLKGEIRAALDRVFARGDFILGRAVVELEERFAAYCGSRFAVGVNSGTDALFLSLKALGIGAGDEVITAPNSFLASASAIVAAGAKPVFADVGEDMNIDPEALSRRITSRTRAVIPVHLTGKPADMRPILETARRHKLFVIEDAAQSIGTLYHGKKTGSLGHLGCFSMHPLKTLNAAGDGGMITTDDPKLHRTLCQLRNIGLKNRSESDIWGYNSRLDSLQAALVLVKFKQLEKWIRRRRQNAAFYRKAIGSVVLCPREESYERHSYHLFVIQAERRDELQKHLEMKGIETKIHYPLPIHLQRCAAGLGHRAGDFPATESQARMILSLPIHQSLTAAQLAAVAEQITGFYRR